MNLKNYTSSVPVDRSVSLIEHDLVRAGAIHISKTYDDKQNLEGITFQIIVNNLSLIFRLPAKWKQCYKVMMEEVRKPRPGTEERIKEQSQRTAWKILYDWVSIQVTMIKLEQADIVEVFLPYVYDMAKDQTLFEKLKASNFKMLAAPKNEA
jgi:hypothetical protein